MAIEIDVNALDVPDEIKVEAVQFLGALAFQWIKDDQEAAAKGIDLKAVPEWRDTNGGTGCFL